jgi:SAM-dependent methyltransferase
MRVLEVGCGPGAAARAVAVRFGPWGHVVGIDRSAAAVRQATAGSTAEIAAGRVTFRRVAVEDFVPAPGEAPFDLAFALRVGALDGRHDDLRDRALAAIAAASRPGGRLFVDGAQVALPDAGGV